MTEDALTAALAETLGLDPVQAGSLARDLDVFSAGEKTRILALLDGVPADSADRIKFAAAAVDVLRMADPDVRALLLDHLPKLARRSVDPALCFLRGAVDFISDRSRPELIRAWARTGAGLAGVSRSGAEEYFLRAGRSLRPVDDHETRVRLVRLLTALPEDRAGDACADLARLAGGLAGVGRRPVLVGLVEKIAPVSWTGALSFLENRETLLRYLGWEFLPVWVEKGLRLAGGAGSAAGRRADLYFSLASAESRGALDRIGPGPALSGLQRYLGFYASIHAGRDLTVAPLGSRPKTRNPEQAGLAFTDGRTIYLPERLPFLEDIADGHRLYRVLTAREAARIGGGTFDLDVDALAGELNDLGFHPPSLEDMPPLERFFQSFPYWRLARDLFRVFDNARVDAALARDYPGLARDLERFAVFFDPDEPDIERPVALLLDIVRRLVQGRRSAGKPPRPIFELAKDLAGRVQSELFRRGATAEDSARLTARNYLRLSEAYQSGLEVRFTKLGAKASTAWDEDSGPETAGVRADSEEKRAATYSLLTRPGRADAVARDLTGLLEKARVRAGDEPEPGGPSYTYDEWDRDLGGYRLSWVRVREASPPLESGDFVARTRLRHARLARQVQRQFELIRPAGLVRKRRLTDGDEPDIDRIIEVMAARRAGGELADDVYIQKRRAARDVAAAVLVDLSGSTSRPVAGGQRVIDLEKESLVLLAEALETVGDTWGLFGFTGTGRERVLFYTVKDFSGRFDASARRRLGALEPGEQNRDGAALRHVAARLAAHRRRRNLLILISDGEPDDYDYQGRYAQADTRAALREIRRLGVNPFCIIVGESGPDHLGRMFAEVEYTVVGRIEALPRKISAIYRRLTT